MKKIGFIGQGYIGKNYADDFEARGFEVIRYSLEEPYIANKGRIKECDVVFIAVPTPTTPDGYDDSLVRGAIQLLKKGAVAVIKSTLLPGTTESIQKQYPDIYVMHSPEFLTRHTAAYDAAHPDRNIIGYSTDSEEHRKKADEVMAILPDAPFKAVCKAIDAELVKYGGNCFFYFKNIFFNLHHDLVKSLGGDWAKVREMITNDSRIHPVHTEPVNKGGRGAGGDCLIKDFEAFKRMYDENVGNPFGSGILENLVHKNIYLLASSGKDLDLLRGVYGEEKIEEILKKADKKNYEGNIE